MLHMEHKSKKIKKILNVSIIKTIFSVRKEKNLIRIWEYSNNNNNNPKKRKKKKLNSDYKRLIDV